MSDDRCSHSGCLDSICDTCCYCNADLLEVRAKQRVYVSPIVIEDFSIDSIISLMEQDKNKLIERWGQKGFDERLRLLKERK